MERDNPADKWFWAALDNTELFAFDGRTYEAVGPHFQGNPYNLSRDILITHDATDIFVDRDFESIKRYLTKNHIEGLVFWLDKKPVCKIKRSDFGFKWP